LLAKRVDLIVANDISEPGAGFEGETNRVTMVAADGSEALPLLAKTEVAVRLVDRLEALLSAVPAPAGSR
jgi:phosphopantothenoylcysteine decarboxylase/phosphopantothenate--cysteine ligase